MLLLLTTALQAQVKFSDLQPEAGKPVIFTYDPTGTKLAKATEIKSQVHSFFSGSPKVTSITLIKEGDLFKGEVPTTDSTTLVAFLFSGDGERDINPAGYYVKMSKGGKIPAEAYANEAFILDMYGRNFGMKPNVEKAIAAYDEAFTLKPALKNKAQFSYLSLNYRLNKESGKKLITDNIDKINKSKSTDEKDLSLVFNLYALIQNKTAADSAKTMLLKYHPTGTTAYLLATRELYGEKDTQVLERKLNAIITKFNLDVTKKTDNDKLTYFYGLLANAYIKEKNYAKFEFYTSKISDKLSRASTYNSVAWPLAEQNLNIAFASEISKKSLDLLVAAKQDEVPAQYQSKEEYIKALNNYYGMFADTYALLLYHAGNYKEALLYEDKSFAMSASKSADMSVRYVTYLKMDGQYEKAFAEAEKLIKNGEATDSVKTDFKMLYAKLGKKENYNTYLSKLEEIAYAKDKETWLKKMINVPAPAFTLANLKGEKVSLADFKGKTVIVDYWATWCGPCIASFPGMQKAIIKYKDNPNVVFLFINTWQNEENREQVVKEYMDNNKKYTFNVLLDTKNKVDPTQFDVISQYKVEGIPTKFIIDGNGNIRFKAVGFSGSADGVVKEIDMMVALASSTDKIAKAK